MSLRFKLLGSPQSLVSISERARSTVGATIGILITGLVCRFGIGPDPALPALIAPMGASAVLLFAVPASPLAQPRAVVGGNLIAAVVGVAMTMLVPDPYVAAALAVGIAIALMATLGCLHPPSGAIALTAVLGDDAIRELGFGFVLWPVAANSLLLLALAFGYNRLVGRSYPHRPPSVTLPGRQDLRPEARTGFLAEDLDAVLAEHDEILDIDRRDLEAVLRQTQIRSFRRSAGRATCATIMSRDVIAISPDAPMREAFDLLRAHHIKALPVTTDNGRVIGIVTQTDLLDKAAWGPKGPRMGWRHRLDLTFSRGRAPNGCIADIMTVPVRTVEPGALLADVVRLMAASGLHHLPVVEPDGRLAGIVSQSDLTVALLAEQALRAQTSIFEDAPSQSL